ncbi:MAG: hypothetical protein IT464_15340 [Planctomycetes bacterium]|nr:hypothetical protein [Planctomycetota bacterium]
MMHPWDRERTWQEAPGNQSGLPSSGSGWVWIVAVVIAVIALAVFARSGGNHLVMVPIGISVFFMCLFMVNHRREMRRVEVARHLQRMGQAEQAPQHAPQSMGFAPPGQPARDDASLRRIFDRFDIKVIEHCRRNHWEPKQISVLLEMARDFVDQPHASALLRADQGKELGRHLDASLERALLQYDIDHNRKGDELRKDNGYYGDDAPPF